MEVGRCGMDRRSSRAEHPDVHICRTPLLYFAHSRRQRQYQSHLREGRGMQRRTSLSDAQVAVGRVGSCSRNTSYINPACRRKSDMGISWVSLQQKYLAFCSFFYSFGRVGFAHYPVITPASPGFIGRRR